VVCVRVTVYQQIENSLITKKDLKRNLEKLTVTVQLFIDTIIESIRHCPPYAPSSVTSVVSVLRPSALTSPPLGAPTTS